MSVVKTLGRSCGKREGERERKKKGETKVICRKDVSFSFQLREMIPENASLNSLNRLEMIKAMAWRGVVS